MRPFARALHALIVTTTLGCAGPTPATWWIEPGSSEIAQRLDVVEASIRAGGCAGPSILYMERFASVGATTPPALGPGTYGFAARARDAGCIWFAAGCVEVTLPAAGVTTRLVAIAEESEPGCLDDAGIVDAGVEDAGIDAGDPRPTCDDTFGSAPGYELCQEGDTTCRFLASTSGDNCNALCAGFGATCVAAEDEVGGTCTAGAAISCAANRDDSICTCTR